MEMKESTGRFRPLAGLTILVVAVAATFAFGAAPGASGQEGSPTPAVGSEVPVTSEGLANDDPQSVVHNVGSGVLCPAIRGLECPPFPVMQVYPDGSLAGVTATGQAQLEGQGDEVRDAAIAQAVADAREQADAAALAAGITLGKVIDLDISAPPFYPVPLPAGAEGGKAGGGAPGSTGSTGAAPVAPIPTCYPDVPCDDTPEFQPMTFVTVTITWEVA